MSKFQKKICCDMRQKVALGIARVYPKDECGIPDVVMAEFHDFSYKSDSNLPVAAALAIRYCPWCGAERDPAEERRTVEVIRPRPKL